MTNQDMLAPDCTPIHPRLLVKVGLNIALNLVTLCCSHKMDYGDLHAVRVHEHLKNHIERRIGQNHTIPRTPKGSFTAFLGWEWRL